MNREQDIKDKESFFRAGQKLLEKVHEAESTDRAEVLLSWEEVEKKLASKPSHKLRIRYVLSAVAASAAILLAIGMSLWKTAEEPVENRRGAGCIRKYVRTGNSGVAGR